MTYQDILYAARDGVATITINRPDRMNALRIGTYDELIEALREAAWDRDIGAIVLTGAGRRAFCVGGDTDDAKSERRGKGIIGVPVEQIHAAIREAPKPVIAKVRGFAIGGTAALLGALLLGVLLAAGFARPLRRMARIAARVDAAIA